MRGKFAPEAKIIAKFVAVLLFTAALYYLASWARGVCSRTDIQIVAPHGSTQGLCIEFWLYRYQTLIAGILALASAFFGAWFVRRQTLVADAARAISAHDYYAARLARHQSLLVLSKKAGNAIDVLVTATPPGYADRPPYGEALKGFAEKAEDLNDEIDKVRGTRHLGERMQDATRNLWYRFSEFRNDALTAPSECQAVDDLRERANAALKNYDQAYRDEECRFIKGMRRADAMIDSI